MAKLSFEDIRNKEKGKVGIVCGNGGSLSKYLSEFEELSKNSKDKYCFVNCNEWYEKTNLSADYWVIANNVLTVERNHEIFNNLNIPLIYADSVDLSNREFVDNKLTVDYLPYDERHFDNKACEPRIKCCNEIVPNRKTIQEYLMEITGHNERYDSCGTVGIHMLAVAVILGCNPIYVSGIDMNYKTGYANGKLATKIHGNLSDCAELFGKQSKIIVESAKKIGIEVIQLSDLAIYEGIEKGEFKKV